MKKNILIISALSLFILAFDGNVCYSKPLVKYAAHKSFARASLFGDTVPPSGVMDVIKKVVYATDNFNIDAVADLYTPNAVIADDEPPYSWNGPTAGVQWVNAIEKVCRDNKLTKLKASIENINVYQQTADNLYIIIPVSYTGNLPGQSQFSAQGAFTFVLRTINGKWMIKSQVWMPRQGL